MTATERTSFETLDLDDLQEVAEESGPRKLPAPPRGLWSDAPPPLPSASPVAVPPAPRVPEEAEVESERLDFDHLVDDLSSRPAPKAASWELAPAPLPAPATLPARAERRGASAGVVIAVALGAYALGLGTMALIGPREAVPVPEREVVIDPVVLPAPTEVEAPAPEAAPVATAEPELVPAPVAAAPGARAPRRSASRPALERAAEPQAPLAEEQAEEAAPASDLPESPAREDVLGAMSGVAPAIESCATDADRGQLARVRFSFASSGRPVHTNVSGVSGPTASCIARAARGARVPSFARDSFVIEYPFQL